MQRRQTIVIAVYAMTANTHQIKTSILAKRGQYAIQDHTYRSMQHRQTIRNVHHAPPKHSQYHITSFNVKHGDRAIQDRTYRSTQRRQTIVIAVYVKMVNIRVMNLPRAAWPGPIVLREVTSQK